MRFWWVPEESLPRKWTCKSSNADLTEILENGVNRRHTASLRQSALTTVQRHPYGEITISNLCYIQGGKGICQKIRMERSSLEDKSGKLFCVWMRSLFCVCKSVKGQMSVFLWNNDFIILVNEYTYTSTTHYFFISKEIVTYSWTHWKCK